MEREIKVVRLVRTLAAARQWSLKTASLRLLGSGADYKRIYENGGTVSRRKAKLAEERFWQHWPHELIALPKQK